MNYHATIYLNYTQKSHVITGVFPDDFVEYFLNHEEWLLYNPNFYTSNPKGWAFPSTDGGIFFLHALRLGLDDYNIDHDLIPYDQIQREKVKKARIEARKSKLKDKLPFCDSPSCFGISPHSPCKPVY